MKQEKVGLSEKEEQMVQDFLNNSSEHSEWEKRFGNRDTLPGRLEFAAQEEGTTENHKIFTRFIAEEIMYHGMMGARLRVYTPPFGEMFGKILIETFDRDEGNLFFEITLNERTDFSGMVMEDMGGDAWNPFFRYHNIFMNKVEARLFLQTLLFFPCFTHVFLMTTMSGALGAITTHDLISGAGHILSFRQCSLNV